MRISNTSPISPANAARRRLIVVIDGLFHSFDVIATNVELGMSLEELRRRLRMYLPSKPAANYIIFYYIVPDGVMISDVIHAARDWIGKFFRGER